MKILIIIIIAAMIIMCVYLSYKQSFKGAIACACLAAVLGFVGPYIVDFVGNLSVHVHQNVYEKKENVIEATCLDSGSYELVSYCECGEELSRETFTIEPQGHNYMTTITEPTCEEEGFTIHTCSRCMDSYVDSYVETLGHNYVDVVTEPSCEEEGFTMHTCSRCKESYVDKKTNALGHDYIEAICSRCGVISSEYEPLIVSRANELVDIGKYDEAFNIVSEALERTNSDSLQQLLSSIQGMQEKESKYTAKNVEFITYNGSINSNDQTDTYSLDVPVTGHYRFDVSDMVNGFFVKLQIYDSAGAKIGGGSGYSNGSGITCELVQGNKYTVKVISYSNTGSYTLTIGQQKEIVNISAKKIIYDSIEYKDQQNEYTFIPSIDGTYRFDFSDVINAISMIR